jgi:hypothetical protein
MKLKIGVIAISFSVAAFGLYGIFHSANTAASLTSCSMFIIGLVCGLLFSQRA